MQRKLLLPFVFASLALLMLVAQNVFASDYGNVQITGVNAPASVDAGQPITVSITVSYEFMGDVNFPSCCGLGVVVALRPHTEMGNPYPIISVSSNCYSPQDVSLCIAQTDQITFMPEVLTVSFTLAAPSTPETWRPSAFAMLVLTTNGVVTQDDILSAVYQVLTITVT